MLWVIHKVFLDPERTENSALASNTVWCRVLPILKVSGKIGNRESQTRLLETPPHVLATSREPTVTLSCPYPRGQSLPLLDVRIPRWGRAFLSGLGVRPFILCSRDSVTYFLRQQKVIKDLFPLHVPGMDLNSRPTNGAMTFSWLLWLGKEWPAYPINTKAKSKYHSRATLSKRDSILLTNTRAFEPQIQS